MSKVSSTHLTPGLFFDGLRQLFLDYAWFASLDKRTQDEVILAHVYAYGSSHGTSGHLGYLTVSTLTQKLNAYEAQLNAEKDSGVQDAVVRTRKYDDDIPF